MLRWSPLTGEHCTSVNDELGHYRRRVDRQRSGSNVYIHARISWDSETTHWQIPVTRIYSSAQKKTSNRLSKQIILDLQSTVIYTVYSLCHNVGWQSRVATRHFYRKSTGGPGGIENTISAFELNGCVLRSSCRATRRLSRSDKTFNFRRAYIPFFLFSPLFLCPRGNTLPNHH